MADYSIGLSGLRVAQQAIEIIGTNIANAATPGYHKQTPKIEPLEMLTENGTVTGGAQLAAVRRAADLLLEAEIVREQPLIGQVAQELSTLESIEGALGEIGSADLADSLLRFFGALRESAGQPNSQALLEQVAWTADSMTAQFRSLAEFLTELKAHVGNQAEQVATEVNALAAEIAAANQRIYEIEMRGGDANLLRDRRDQAIKELAELVDVQAEARQGAQGITDVMAWGQQLVFGSTVIDLAVGLDHDGNLGVGTADSTYYESALTGGKLGGLMALSNELIPAIEAKLDALAGQIIAQVNALHVQGVGAAGSFTELTGDPISDDLSEWATDVTGGTLRIRLINTVSGEVENLSVAIDPADSLTDIAADIDALDANLSVSVVASKLTFRAASGYVFDFLPAPVLDTTSSPWTGLSQPAIRGIYTGSADETYTCTIVGQGNPGDAAQVGVTAGLGLEVTNAAGDVVTILSLDENYSPGAALELDSGLKLTLTAGTVMLGEEFIVEAAAQSDSSGLLAAAGINTFFSGSSAASFAVRDEILQNAGRIAVALSADLSDNVNVLRMADLQSQEMAGLGGIRPVDYYSRLVTSVGQEVAIRRTRNESLANVLNRLEYQRDLVSGVDINEEAANLMMFERMFQGVAKYMSAQERAIQYLMDMV